MIRMLFKPRNWLWIAGALVTAGIVHVMTVFAAAELSNSPLRALEAAGSVNAMTVLPPVTAATQPMPFMSGDTRYAFCPFDLASSPLFVRTRFGEGIWTIAVFDRAGAMLYSVTNTELQRRDAVLVIARITESRAASLPISRQAATTNITVNVPEARGLALIQAPILGAGFEAETEALLQEASCEPVSAEVDAAPAQ